MWGSQPANVPEFLNRLRKMGTSDTKKEKDDNRGFQRNKSFQSSHARSGDKSNAGKIRREFDEKGNRVCFSCQAPGHMLADCPVRKTGKPRESSSLNVMSVEGADPCSSKN